MGYEELSTNIDSNALGNIASILAGYSTVAMIIGLLTIIELWIIFKKCGKKGWLSIVPIANVWTFLSIAGLPGWLCLVPVANIVGMIFAYFKIPKRFGKSGAFGLGALFLPVIFFGILAFSKVQGDGESKMESKKEEQNNNVPNEVPNSNILENNATPDLMAPPSMENQNGAPDLMAAPSLDDNNNKEINVVEEEKQFMVEEPALNVEESNDSLDIPLVDNNISNDSVMNVPEASVVNAFEMPTPAVNNPVINDITNTNVMGNESNSVTNNVVETPTPLDNLIIDDTIQSSPVDSLASVNPVQDVTTSNTNLDSLNSNAQSLDINPNSPQTLDTLDTLDATFELPKMANEVINGDITAKKTCPSCGFENDYTNKTCIMCGNNLE